MARIDLNTFKISLNPDIAFQLCHAINAKRHISMTIPIHCKKAILAGDKICAIMYRIIDTVDYLNQLELRPGKYTRTAFDFCNFMSNASVLIECIDHIAEIFSVDMTEIDSSSSIFNELGKYGTGTDREYFKYLRSLCAVHPIDTCGHKTYQANDFECSPFVVWSNLSDSKDLQVWVYTSLDEAPAKCINIYLDRIFSYVKSQYDSLELIIQEIPLYQANVIQDFIQKSLKQRADFANCIEYLNYLICLAEERFGGLGTDGLGFIIDILQLELSNPINNEPFGKYKNALKYSIPFFANSLQNMTSDGFENSGLKYPDDWGTSLLIELCSPHSPSQPTYAIEKLGDILGIVGDRQYAYAMLNGEKSFFERYISLDNVSSDFEYYALVHTALYHDCLASKCLINKNIPNNNIYRECILTEEEWNRLITEEPRKASNIHIEDILAAMKDKEE